MDILGFLTESPWVEAVLRIVLIAFIIITGYIFVMRWREGDDIEVWIFKARRNQALQECSENLKDAIRKFESMEQVCGQKKLVLQVFADVIRAMRTLGSTPADTEFEDTKHGVYNLILQAVASCLTKAQDNAHKIVIFFPCPTDPDCLCMEYSHGHSPNGIKYCRLRINDSLAGNVYHRGKLHVTGDVTADPLFKRLEKSSEFHSLACLPIELTGNTVGVLSMTGFKKNSFNDDDIDYLRYFAHLIGLLRQMELCRHRCRAVQEKGGIG